MGFSLVVLGGGYSLVVVHGLLNAVASRVDSGGPVVKNPPANEGDMDSIPSPGTNIPQATGA